MRKILIVFITSILVLFLVFISSLLIFSIKHQETIEQSITDYINSSFENTIHIESFHLTYLNNFPNARLSLSNVVLSDDSCEVIRIGSINVFFNIWNFLNENIEINRIIISDAIINDRIDINGNKSKIMFSENTSSGKKSGLPVHILSPDLELNNIKLSLTNDYKKNETYITINQSLFNLELDQNIISLSGNLSGNLDSLKSNGFTLFSNKKVEGNDIIFKINIKEGHTYLESGYLETNSLILHPTVSFKKQENGNMVKLIIESSGNLDAHLNLFNLPEGITLKQLNEDAEIKISYNQDGLVNPLTRPFNQLKFEIQNAHFSSPSIPYPVQHLHIIGNYNNGEKHRPETNNLIVDTLNFEIEESYVNARLLVNNLKDPVVKGHFISEIDLKHILHDDKFSATGSVRADLFIDGKISELRELHLNNEQHAYGNVQIDSVDLLLRKSENRIRIPSGNINLDNHYVEIIDLNGQFNDSFFEIQAEMNNLDDFILNNKSPIKGNISIASDYINIESFINAKDTIKGNQKKLKIPNTNLDINLQAKTIEGNFGTIDQLYFIGNLDHENLSIDNLTFNFEDGIVNTNLMIKLGENGLEINGGKINAEFNHLDFDKILNSGKGKAKSSHAMQIPKDLDFQFDLSAKSGVVLGKEIRNFDMNVIFSNGDIEVKKMETELMGGKLSLYSDIKYNQEGIWYVKADGNTTFPHLSIRELLNDFHKENSSSSKTKKPFKLPEIVDINIGVEIDSLAYGRMLFNNIYTNIKASRDEIDIEDFSIDLNKGLGRIDLQWVNYLQDDPRIIGNIDLAFDSVNIQTIYESISGFSSNKKHSEKKLSHEIPHNVDINLKTSANFLQYQNIIIENLHLSSNIIDGIFSISDINFNTAGGHIKFSGLCIQHDKKLIDGHFYTTGKRLSIDPLIKSFTNTDLADGRHGNIEGNLSFEAEGLFQMDSLLNIVTDQNLFYSDIIIKEGKIINNPQLDTTLSFIGHRAKDNVLIKNSEFQIFINGRDIILQDVLVNNSISDMDIFGRYYEYDSAINLNFRVSLTDLFFRTKQKRYVDTNDGQIRLFKDLSVFIELDNSSPKHKIRLHPKRKHRLKRKDLEAEIKAIVIEYRTRLNNLYLDADPKVEESRLPLEVLKD